jgi:hypothetical protein
MRDHTRRWMWAVAATIAVGAAGCGTTGGSPAAGPTTAPAPAFTAAMAPGFASQPAWSVDVPWKMGFTSSGSQIAPDLGLMVMQAEAGFIQMVGASLAVVSFAENPGTSTRSASVQFRSMATGALLSTVDLPTEGSFNGLFVDSVGGRPVAVVHHGASAPAAQAGSSKESVKVTAVYGADGSLVWTSQGRAIASGQADSSGLVTFPNGFPIYSAGYTVRYNGSPDPNGRSFDVLDPTGAAALHVPGTGADGEQVHVSLADGYALVSSISQGQAAGGSASSASMSAYDLGHGAARVGQWTEPAAAAPSGKGELLAADGGRLLVAWPASGTGAKAVTGMAVLDAKTGTASTVSGIPSDAASAAALGAIWDPSTGGLTVYDADTTQTGPAFGINLASGAVAWLQPSGQGSLQPVSTFGGAVYAVQLGTASAPASMITIRESDGAVTAHGYQIAPVAFTDHGTAVFAQSTSPTTLTTARIGVSAASGAS